MTTPQMITDHLHDKTHRHHLFTASMIFVVEVALTLGGKPSSST
jgi:hypothetical protein